MKNEKENSFFKKSFFWSRPPWSERIVFLLNKDFEIFRCFNVLHIVPISIINEIMYLIGNLNKYCK